MVVTSSNSRWQQLFKYDEGKKRFFNVKDLRAIDIDGRRDEEGNTVGLAKPEDNVVT